MKTNTIIFGVLFILFTTSNYNLNAQNKNKSKIKIKENTFSKKNGIYYFTDSLDNVLDLVDTTSLIIKFKNSIKQNQIDSFELMYNLSFIEISHNGLYVYMVSNKSSVIISDSIQSHQFIENISVPVVAIFHSTSNDPQRNNQWGLDRININDAWNETTGNDNIVVAVLDNGVDWNHEDLGFGNDSYQSLCYNTGEDAWADPNDPTSGNGIDDDGNGKIDDWKWWNFYDNNNNTNPSTTGQKRNHGTVCAGLIGAKTNNNIGISGVAGGWNNNGVKIMPVKVGNGYQGSDIAMYNGVKYACDNGADVILYLWEVLVIQMELI